MIFNTWNGYKKAGAMKPFNEQKTITFKMIYSQLAILLHFIKSSTFLFASLIYRIHIGKLQFFHSRPNTITLNYFTSASLMSFVPEYIKSISFTQKKYHSANTAKRHPWRNWCKIHAIF